MADRRQQALDLGDAHRVLGCRSDDLQLEHLADIQVLGWDKATTLRAGADGAQQRRELIAAVRAGQHVELGLSALTFRQKDGVPNRRYLRFAPGALEAVAASFKGMPVLLDHNTYEQRARVGTITSSELVHHGGTGWSAFRMGLAIVKPDAVISVLDGTLDRFSIGWSATGAVTCSVHKTNVRGKGRCGCWPGDTVEMDGAKHVVEFQFESAEGTEVSAVNVPAVKGTRIDDVRAALADELGLVISADPSKESDMSTPILAAILAALGTTDENRAVPLIESERRARLAAEQERDTARTELAAEKKAHETTKLSIGKAVIDGILDGAYRDGKLRYGRDSEGAALPSRFEPMLRKLGASEGVEALRAEVAAMPRIVPIGEAVLDTAGEPARTELGVAPIGNDGLTADEREVARQLNLKPEDMLATKRRMAGGQ